MKFFVSIVWTFQLVIYIVSAHVGHTPSWLDVFVPLLYLIIRSWTEYSEEHMMKNLTKHSKCDRCNTDKSQCQYCRDYYKYCWVPTASKFTDSKPKYLRNYQGWVNHNELCIFKEKDNEEER